MNRTPWFPHNVKPKRTGVYQRKYEWGVDFAYFDGKDWSAAGSSAEVALLWKHMKVATQASWRGLLQKESVATP